MLFAHIGEWFGHLPDWAVIAIIAIVGGFTVSIVKVIAKSVGRAREVEAMAALKRDLVAQGRPTDEIERICDAGMRRNS